MFCPLRGAKKMYQLMDYNTLYTHSRLSIHKISQSNDNPHTPFPKYIPYTF